MLSKLRELEQKIKSCQRCPLYLEVNAPVPGLLNLNSKYFLIGEAPGKTEDKYGTPFIGQSGRRLNELLELAGIDMNDCSLDNVVKCRPPKNRDPRKAELRACVGWLFEAIRLVKPMTLITLGRIPLSLFAPYGIKQLHGTSFMVEISDEGEQIG